MADGHPYEHDLLAFLEDELPRAERDAVSLHLETCPDCRQAVADAEAGRALVRAAAPLQLSAQRRAAIAASLGPVAAPRRRPSRRLVAVLAATLVLGTALGTALVRSGSDNSGEIGASGGALTDAGAQERDDGAAAPTAPGRTLVGRVAGPPATVAEALRGDGFDATVQDGTVVVTADETQRDELERTVAELDPGPVAVYVK